MDLRQFLTTVKALEGLGEDEIALLAARSRLVRCRDGDRIVEKGQDNDSVWVVFEGAVRVLKHVGLTETVCLAVLRKGEIFGEMSVLGNNKPVADVVADGPCIVARVPGPTFRHVVTGNPKARRALGSTLTRRTREFIHKK